MVRMILALVLGVVLMGCEQKNSPEAPIVEEQNEKVSEFDPEKYDLLDLSPFGLEAQIHVPNRTVTNVPPSVSLNDASGIISVHSGKKFNLNITETEIDKSVLIGDLEGDLLFKNTIKEEEENFIRYTSELPDGSQVYNHFCAWINVGGTTYLVENKKSENYSDHYLNRMIKSVKSIQLNNSI